MCIEHDKGRAAPQSPKIGGDELMRWVVVCGRSQWIFLAISISLPPHNNMIMYIVLDVTNQWREKS